MTHVPTPMHATAKIWKLRLTATAPPQPQGYRAQTTEETYVGMICGYEAGMSEAVDKEIEVFRVDGTLPESVAGLEALAKLLGVNR